MSSITELANIALRRVGATPLLSLNEGSAQANTVNDLIPVIRDAMFRDHTWKFAKKQIALAQYATSPVYGYAFAYVLPGDVVFVLEMEDFGKFNLMNINGQRVLVTDDATANITYRSKVEDSQMWDPAFVAAFIANLAAQLALSLVKNFDLHQSLMAEYQLAIDAAIATDSIEQSEVRIISPGDLIFCRGYSYSGKKVGSI